MIEALNARFTDVVGPDVSDICYATQNRQTAVRDLCAEVDVLLVVGAQNSSNSNRLREIGVEMGVPSYLIADGRRSIRRGSRASATVGLTAGASAPEELVQGVIAALRALGDVEVTTMAGIEEHQSFRLPPSLERATPARDRTGVAGVSV